MESVISATERLAWFWAAHEAIREGGRRIRRQRPVVILDSGVGGLTVSRHLEQLLPQASVLYVADSDWFPYGDKSSAAIARRLEVLLAGIVEHFDPLAIIVACNTASTAMVEHGVESPGPACFLVIPELEEAMRRSANKQIALLATPGTLGNVAPKLEALASHAVIWPIPSQRLVEMAEDRMAGVDIDMTGFVAGVGAHLTVEQRLAVDTVILGCTHFPHLVDDLRDVFPSARHWVDPALQVARQVASFVRGKLRGAGPPIKVAAFTSSQGAVRYQGVFMGLGFGVAACERRVTTEQEALI